MGRTTKKLNFLIDESICRELERLVPAGKRSKVVNKALRRELDAIRRKKAAEKLVTSQTIGKKFSNTKIIEGLAKDRSIP